MYFVYTLSSPEDNQVRYVGITCKSLKRRLNNHFWDRANLHKQNWFSNLQKKNLIPIISPVWTGLTLAQAAEFEIQFIQHLKNSGVNLLNASLGGENSRIGCRHSGVSKEKMRIAHLGQIISPEHRLKLSLALKGRLKTLEHAKNISLGKLGIPNSPGHIEKMRLARLGKRASFETRAKISASQLLRWKKRKEAKCSE